LSLDKNMSKYESKIVTYENLMMLKIAWKKGVKYNDRRGEQVRHLR